MTFSVSPKSRTGISSEAMSPQRRAAWKKRLSKLTRVQLIELEGGIKKLLEEGVFDAEFEIASRYCGSPQRVHRTIVDHGRRKLQEIYCSEDRCSKCPHGPFWFAFRSSKRHGTKVHFQSAPALPPGVIEQMNDDIRAPIAFVEIKTGRPSDWPAIKYSR